MIPIFIRFSELCYFCVNYEDFTTYKHCRIFFNTPSIFYTFSRLSDPALTVFVAVTRVREQHKFFSCERVAAFCNPYITLKNRRNVLTMVA